MKSELISIDKVADMLNISKTGAKSLIKKGLIESKGTQVIQQSVLELIDMRDDALNTDDILQYLNIEKRQIFFDMIRFGLFPKKDFQIGKFRYWKVETVRKYL